MTLELLKSFMSELGARFIVYKQLSENDNSKNQVYLGGSYDVLQILPYQDIEIFAEGKRPNFKAKMNFYWLDDSGHCELAPNTKLILYPKYPEVRMSGFLSKCSIAPSKYMKPPVASERTGDKDGRILLMAPVGERIYAYLAPKGSVISNELSITIIDGVFGRIDLDDQDTKQELIDTLRLLYKTNPHELVRLHPDGIIRPYSARNAAGYTFEAAFGIIPNGKADPDYKGWELKCLKSGNVTLMTPEPDGGEYRRLGVREFVHEYGHYTAENKEYFTGPYDVNDNYKFGIRRNLAVLGYDFEKRKITDVNGAIVLLQDELALASWSFAHILTHWSRKHEKACYVKYTSRPEPKKNFIDFKPQALLCQNTSPEYFLDSVIDGLITYDPGCRISELGEVKPRNQFRVNERNLPKLYGWHEFVDLDIE